jgi:hypothetical protein
MIAVGIGKDAERKELRLMTNQDDDVVMTESFDALLKKVKGFADTACEG